MTVKKKSNEDKIADFCRKLNKAYSDWDKTPLGWLSYYDAKQKAYEELIDECNEAAYIDGFWRIVQNGGNWETRLLDAIQALHHGTPCQACGNVRVKWPNRNCDSCIAEKKAKLEETKEARKALRKRKRLKKQPKSTTKWKMTQIKRK